jgi:SAM-dependent methyltransferase
VGLRAQQRSWDELALVDPHWAVISDPNRRHRGWESEAALREFARTGEDEVAHVLTVAAQFDAPLEHGRALDFGCGLGRLTRALSSRFASCVGVDISGEMTQRAAVLNADRANVDFRINANPDLSMFSSASFDLVLAELVLQHMPSARIAIAYIEEFLRLLRPAGIAIFQVPVAVPRRNRLRVRSRSYRALRALRFPHGLLYGKLGLHPITMAVSIPYREIEQIAADAQCDVVVVEDEATPGRVATPKYYVRKRMNEGA